VPANPDQVLKLECRHLSLAEACGHFGCLAGDLWPGCLGDAKEMLVGARAPFDILKNISREDNGDGIIAPGKLVQRPLPVLS
jgi:hypothetical protein